MVENLGCCKALPFTPVQPEASASAATFQMKHPIGFNTGPYQNAMTPRAQPGAAIIGWDRWDTSGFELNKRVITPRFDDAMWNP